MAMIICKECNKPISEQATKCPFCGMPNAEELMLIQMTAKKWKLMMLIGLLLFLPSIVVFIMSYSHGGWDNGASYICLLIVLVGLGSFLTGKIGAWWSNG